MMNQQEIHDFIKDFFIENESNILEESLGHIQVQLSIDMDKRLMNRPFYWHYIEKIGGHPNPMQLTLITNSKAAPDDIKGGHLHFGSPRLHQIFDTAKEKGSHALLYESVHVEGKSYPLKPWLVVNGVISYSCHDKKDHFFSIGLSLITGEMIFDMHDCMVKNTFQEQIPNYCFTMTPIIKPLSGLERIKKYLIEKENSKNHDWAKDALERMEKDEKILEAFYKGEEEKPPSYYQEKEAIQTQYEPKIELSIINGGLFYFFHHPLEASKK